MHKFLSISILAILLSYSYSQDEILVKNDLLLINKVNGFPKYNGVDDKDYYFSGFLVIKIDLNNQFYDENFIYAKIFWINDINNLEDEKYYLWYYPFISTWLNAISELQSIYSTMDKYSSTFPFYYYLFNKYSNCPSYLFDEKDYLKSDMFRDELQLYESKNFVYFLFRTSFKCVILNVEMPLTILDQTEYINQKILVPISKIERFINVKDLDQIDSYLKPCNIKFRLK